MEINQSRSNSSLQEELDAIEIELAAVEEEIQELLTRQTSLTDRKSELQAAINHNEIETEQKVHQWEGKDFPWTADLDRHLKDVFKLSSLRPMQRQTMNATLAKEDTLLIMPTGGGKSLCFQLPAVVNEGLTLVVSPLVSLMEDQQMALEQLGVQSAMLQAATSKEDLKFVQDEMVTPGATARLKLLYVTPEKLAKSKRFMNRLEKCYSLGRLARIVIDEVHCCSQWGHDFRPDYKFLGIMKRQFPTTPILGLTATATTPVLNDVKKMLNIPRALVFKASFNRANLFYEVVQKPSSQKETIDEVHRLIRKRFHSKSGIVYCFSRKETEEVTSNLLSRGVKAGCYHADMDARSRSKVHRDWLSGHVQVVVATVAFGMGIDKPDVRFVIHHSISKSMENLYQESGRAGRDDKRADCIVMYRFADVARQSSMVFTEQMGLQNLHGIVRYCNDIASCRRSVLASHFGEVWDTSHCNTMCDHCKLFATTGPSKSREVTKYCQDVITILDAAAATEQRITSAKLVDAWFGRGPSGLKVKSVAIPPLDKDTAERVLAHMLVHGYIQEDFHFTAYSTICYIVAGPKAKLLGSKALKVYMDFRLKSASTTPNKNNISPKVASAASTFVSASSQKCSSASLSSSESKSHNCTTSNKRATEGNKQLQISSSKPSASLVSGSFAPSEQDSPLQAQKNAEKSICVDINDKAEEVRSGDKNYSSLTVLCKTSSKDLSRKLKVSKSCGKDEKSKSNSAIHNKSDEKKTSALSAAEDGGSVKRGEQLRPKKRLLVFSDVSEDELDFDIKKPCTQRPVRTSIVISDDCDSEGGDDVMCKS